ncbi:MAG: hypothetical protein VX278_15500, partial [Myxococcota bacterium]|nr:hypothetical protein [Myxococcota bacterium]
MKNNGSAIFLPLSILIFCPQAIAQGGALVGPSYSGTDGLIEVTAFGVHDQSQCENVDQTGGERPEACPSIEEAQSLSFMAFGDQDMPLQGYGIGDSVINEDG